MTDLGSNIDHPMNPVKIALTAPAPSPLERGYAVGGGGRLSEGGQTSGEYLSQAGVGTSYFTSHCAGGR